MRHNPFRYIHSEKGVLELVNTPLYNIKDEGEKFAENFELCRNGCGIRPRTAIIHKCTGITADFQFVMRKNGGKEENDIYDMELNH